MRATSRASAIVSSSERRAHQLRRPIGERELRDMHHGDPRFQPVIAQVHGVCLSGGGELLAVCDLVVASEEARFGHPAGRDLGIPPTVFLWPNLIGLRKTRELLYTAKLIATGGALRNPHVRVGADTPGMRSSVASDTEPGVDDGMRVVRFEGYELIGIR